jgi:hypothetical protein
MGASHQEWLSVDALLRVLTMLVADRLSLGEAVCGRAAARPY